MNKLLKTILLIVYTFALFFVSLLIVFLSTRSARFDDYTNLPYNNDITLNTQVIEKRESKEENNSDYEESEYNLYFFITKKIDLTIQNLNAFVGVESEDGIKYAQSTTSKTLTGGVYQISTLKVSNANGDFAYNKVDVKDDVITYNNRIPETIYIKIAYEVKDVDKTIKSRELNYAFDFNNVEKTKFEKYETRSVKANYIDYKEDLFSIKLTHRLEKATDNGIDRDIFKFNVLDMVESNIPEGTRIKNANIEVVGEITNKSMISEKYFSKYIRMFTYNGCMVSGRRIANSRTLELDHNYKVERLYITGTIDLDNGKTVKTTYSVLVKDLLEN